MSGVFGFRHQGKDMLTFSKASAEEMHAGLKSCIAKFTTRAMQQAAGRIVLMNGKTKTTEAQRLEVGRKYEGTTGGFTWRSLLWQTATIASIRPWVKDGLIYMVDDSALLADPKCEYVYIVDLDRLGLTTRLLVSPGFMGGYMTDFSTIRGGK